MVLSDEVKGIIKGGQLSVEELNESKPSDDVSKEYLLTKLLASSTDRTDCKDKLHTDYRSTGIEAAGTLKWSEGFSSFVCTKKDNIDKSMDDQV